MLELESKTVLFPTIPESLKKHFGIGELFLRPFGYLEEDLTIDFKGQLRPNLETQILECCTQDSQGRKCDRSFFWQLEIGKRTECLVILASLGDNSDLSCELRCLNLNCREMMEIELFREEITSKQQSADENSLVKVSLKGRQFSLRKPTGCDQIPWLNQFFPDRNSVLETILYTLLPEEQKINFQQFCIQEAESVQTMVERIAQTLEENDPLINFCLRVNCPYCGNQGLYNVDLGALCLKKLYHAQQHLFQTIHCLASHYHWSEADIFAVPPWRRNYYLRLIERDLNQ